jgi:uncharacterized membrane protein YkoI
MFIMNPRFRSFVLSGLVVGPASCVATLAQAQSPVSLSCLSSVEMREAISASHAVQPELAMKNARAAAPGDVVRMRLCRDDEMLVYQVTTVKRDGRVQRVTVEASSGKVTDVR